MSLPQTVVVYPHSNSTTGPPSHSKNSYGPVLVILAGIIVLAVFACFIQRLCAGLFPKKAGHNHNFHKHDPENGFSMSIRTTNPADTREREFNAAAYGETREAMPGRNGGPTSSA